MTDSDASGMDATGRRATVTTTHADAMTADRVAAAVGPDNTDSMDTQADGPRVVTTVTRETTGGLQSTVDDYVVNATVAAQLSTDPDSPDGESTRHHTTHE